MKKIVFLFSVFLFCSAAFVFARRDVSRFRIVSYNLENLFDTEHDEGKFDEDFTPSGNHHWTYPRYKDKLNAIAKTLIAVGEGTPPDLIGLCEIENRRVLDDLVKWKTPLAKCGYEILHRESPDARGIDVALLYQPERFSVQSLNFIPVRTTAGRPSRDILYAKGVVPSGDTLHVFVNHWPSRRGNELASEENRCRAAAVLRERVDSLFAGIQPPLIVIMGDFNDYPDNKSIAEVLRANPVYENYCCPRELFNLFYKYQENRLIGTYKFQNEWNVLDQMIVSGGLLLGERFYTDGDKNAEIFQAPFLFVGGNAGSSGAPFRTYQGMAYKGGISDHLPIYVDFVCKIR